MDRPVIFVIQSHTWNAQMSPGCVLLIYEQILPVLSRSHCWAADSRRTIFSQIVESVEGRQMILSWSRIKSFLSLEKQQQRQNPCRQGWEAALPVESPYPSYYVYHFSFSHTCWVSTVAPKGVSSSEYHHTAILFWRTLCQLLCPGNHIACSNSLY